MLLQQTSKKQEEKNAEINKKNNSISYKRKNTQIIKNLIDTLITNKRVALLGDVANKYTQLFDQLRDTQIAKVTSATPLTKELEEKVLAKVKELTGKTTEIENTVDESILGGFILRVGDLQYDASIANKLNNLKREFTLN